MMEQREAISRGPRSSSRLAFSALLLFLVVGTTSASRFGFAPKTRLTWVNGIGYNTTHMKREAPAIAECFGGKKVDFYHNPTKMVDEKDTRGYVSDLTQAGQQKYLGRITSEVNGLVDHLRSAVRSVQRNGIVVHIAHSQGALVTCLAAKQLTPLEMNRIEVISFGGATPIRSTAATPFRRCINYYSVNDPLLFLNPSAESALRSGFKVESEAEFCFLAPRVGDPVADHMLLGPTYAAALEWEGRRFERKYQSYLRRTVRFALLTSVAIFSTIFRFLAFLCQLLCRLLLERQLQLRRALVRSLVIKFRGVLSCVIAMLVRIVTFFRNHRHRPETTSVPIRGTETTKFTAETENSKVVESAPEALARID